MVPISHISYYNFFPYYHYSPFSSSFPFFPVLYLVLLLPLRCFLVPLTHTISLGFHKSFLYLLRSFIIPISRLICNKIFFFHGVLHLAPKIFSRFFFSPHFPFFFLLPSLSPLTLTVPLGLNNLLRYPLRKERGGEKEQVAC